MRTISSAIVLVLVLALAAPTSAGRKPHQWPKVGVETRIPFPGESTILSFEADEDAGVWLEDHHHRWYYVALTGSCMGLSFARQIGFKTNGLSRFDKFSSIVVEGRRCKVQSVVTADQPLPRSERLRLKAQAKAQTAPAN
jgi:hypothetical protein